MGNIASAEQQPKKKLTSQQIRRQRVKTQYAGANVTDPKILNILVRNKSGKK